MSTDFNPVDVYHGDDHHGGDAAHGSYREYWTGFIASVVLTAIPFALVMTMPLTTQATAAIIMIFAAAQIVVHMVYFLHMNSRAEGGWSMMALIFTIVVIGISLSGSIWVMYHMNANMMPTQMVMDSGQ